MRKPALALLALPVAAASRRLGDPPLAFGEPRFFTDRYVPTKTPGVVLKVPDFDAVFAEARRISPLAKQALDEVAPRGGKVPGGLAAIGPGDDPLDWTCTDDTPRRLVRRIDKVDDYLGRGTPLLRFRSSLVGPIERRGLVFSDLVSDLSLRPKWDAACAYVEQIHEAADLADVAELQGNRYGVPELFGVGYVRTKQSIVSPREQMVLCGLQTFPSGASLTWGVELEGSQDSLFPPEAEFRRVQRSTSHVFLATTVPTGEERFDVEYAIQLDVGGLPGWIVGPAVAETIKKLFRFADGYFRSGLVEGGELARKLEALRGEQDSAQGDRTAEADRGKGAGVEGVADDGEEDGEEDGKEGGGAEARAARLAAALPPSAPPPATRTAAQVAFFGLGETATPSAEITQEASPEETEAGAATARTQAQIEFFGLDKTPATPPVTPGIPAATEAEANKDGAAAPPAPAPPAKLRKRDRLKKWLRGKGRGG